MLALLGPNGAGKTTLVRIIATLLTPDSGRVAVGGHDVTRDRLAVRRLIGLSGQSASVDERLSGHENLRLAARLYHLDRRQSERRVGELIERFDLGGVADTPARSYSGGMRRLADSIAIIDSGRVIAEGTSSELKGAAGHWFVEVVTADRDQAHAAAAAIV